ncbi:MipA/OmpV family protein [Geovibrio thiophilus]|uniref:MipA/OmpV family protein n=1 Tax=Geovibrio thiophilus TaxID=139438 RepID=A0A3R5UU98_9BACT|nr:MipA/OmpV family protein [Geovibrio thiophilus]QAR32645.1 MipA/OmpV family protein [Geovibrio thiophilus]
MLYNLRSIVFTSLLLAILTAGVRAEEKDWNYSVGGGVMYGAAYEGSDKYVVKAVPDVSVEYKEGVFFAGIMGGIGGYPVLTEDYKLGAAVGFDFGRSEDDDKGNLRGMGDIDMSATLSLMGEYSFGPLQVSGKATKGTEDYGTTATVELGTMFPIGDKLMIMASVGSTWADNDHMESYFGVSQKQAARSTYSRYDAEAGLKSVGFALGAFYNITESWDVKLMINGDQFLGDAADSPLTKDDFNPSVFFTTGFNF